MGSTFCQKSSVNSNNVSEFQMFQIAWGLRQQSERHISIIAASVGQTAEWICFCWGGSSQ